MELEIGTISARGQVAIPSQIRNKMHLKEGEKIIFALEKEVLLIRKVSELSWEEITKPLRTANKKISEQEVPELIKRLRRQKIENSA